MILQDAFVFRKSAGAFLRIRFCIIEKVWNTVILPSVHSNTLLRRFPVNGNSLFLIIQKTVPDSSSETVIITYYRGTTQLGVSPTFSRTIIRSWLITGSVPGVSYCGWDISLFRSALKSPFSTLLCTAIPPPAVLCDITLNAYYSFSSVLSFIVVKYNTEHLFCQPFLQNFSFFLQGFSISS